MGWRYINCDYNSYLNMKKFMSHLSQIELNFSDIIDGMI